MLLLMTSPCGIGARSRKLLIEVCIGLLDSHSVCVRSSRGSSVVANPAPWGHGDPEGLGTTRPSAQRFEKVGLEVWVEPAVDEEVADAVDDHQEVGQVGGAHEPHRGQKITTAPITGKIQ